MQVFIYVFKLSKTLRQLKYPVWHQYWQGIIYLLPFLLSCLPMELLFRKAVRPSRLSPFSFSGFGYLAKKARAHFEKRSGNMAEIPIYWLNMATWSLFFYPCSLSYQKFPDFIISLMARFFLFMITLCRLSFC